MQKLMSVLSAYWLPLPIFDVCIRCRDDKIKGLPIITILLAVLQGSRETGRCESSCC
jgi:hypothetical protein